MADYNGIDEMYRIVGIRSIGVPGVFPKPHVAKKKKKRSEEEEEAMKKSKERESAETSGVSSEGIDIKV